MTNRLDKVVAFLSQKNRALKARRDERRRASQPTGFGVLAIMKNEGMNIDEWVTHYLQVGADHIFLIDNGSTDDTVRKAEAWVAKGQVHLIIRPKQHRQLGHYWDAIKRFKVRDRCAWLLIADMDEFWFCPDGRSIPSRLADDQYERLDVIYANWRMFGSSGLVEHPDSIRKSLVHCDPVLYNHSSTKFICRTSVLSSSRCLKVHKVRGSDSSRTVSDNENFHLFHYPIQSLAYFKAVKMTRGDVSSARSDTVRGMDYFRSYDAPCTVENRLLADLVETDRLGRATPANPR
jgi:glycosyltransferase involved in cell wall biosynthesis